MSNSAVSCEPLLDGRHAIRRTLVIVGAVLLAVAGCSDSESSATDSASGGTTGTFDGGGGRGGSGGSAGTGGGSGGAGGTPMRLDASVDAPGADASVDGGDDGGGDAALPTCSDGRKNGTETDVDCGGTCGKCAAGQTCVAASDCVSGACNGAQRCDECVQASACPGQDSECAKRTCTNGACGMMNVAAGTALDTQTAGDCKQRRCNGQGAVETVAFDTDVPNDSNPCTNDSCASGAPTFTPLASGADCGGNGKCNDAGQCVGCVVPTDCPGTDTTCRSRTCTNGVCGFANLAAGTALPTQTTGDCKRVECDGAGNERTANDDADLPADDNPCTKDLCNQGTASHAPEPSSTACGAGLVCDGANRCVECLNASTCPGTDGECQTRTCLNGACGLQFVPTGTTAPMQTPGDCVRRRCDGAGGISVTTDQGDAPNDGNPCTLDGCLGTTPYFQPRAAGESCGGALICDGKGACLGCLTGSDCAGADTACGMRTCTAGQCGYSELQAGTVLASQTSGDCKRNQCAGDGAGGIAAANDDNDVPADGNDCTADLCSLGVPSNPPLGMGISCNSNGGRVCDGAGGCVACNVAADCPGADTDCSVRTCSNHVCGVMNTMRAAACDDGGGDRCDGSGACVPSVMVVRTGTGATLVSAAAVPVFLEERMLDDGSVVRTLALPTAAAAGVNPLTLSGTADSEGGLSRSADARYVTVAGYAAAPGTASVGSTEGILRVVGRVDAAGTIDTSTAIPRCTPVSPATTCNNPDPFRKDNVRGVTSNDGSGFWVSGNGDGNRGGIWYVPFGGTSATQVVVASNTPTNVRICHIVGGQLVCSTDKNPFGLVKVGTGLPTTATTASQLPFSPALANGVSPWSFVFFDLDPNVAGNDTLYFAEDGNGKGIRKFTFDGQGWTEVTTSGAYTGAGVTTGFRGLTGYLAGGKVVLIAVAAASKANALVKMEQSANDAPTWTPLATAGAETTFRGVALSPRP